MPCSDNVLFKPTFARAVYINTISYFLLHVPCNALYYIILYYIVLYYIILYYIILYYIIHIGTGHPVVFEVQ